MSDNDSTGYGESPDTADSDANLIDGQTGDTVHRRVRGYPVTFR